MAVATANVPINMHSWPIWYGEVTNYNSTYIRIQSSGQVQEYSGSGFTFDMYGDVTGGTLQGTTYTLNGVQQYNVTQINRGAEQFNNLLGEGNGQNVLSYIFQGNDVLNGSSGADSANGYAGNDTINGKGGIDNINGGTGNDTMIYGAGDTFNGGSGIDTLKITGNLNVNLTTAAHPNNKLLNTEQIDLRAGIHTLTLNASDVLAMSPTDQVKILGDAADTVNIAGTQSAGTPVAGGYTRYTIGGATLLIDSDIDVL